jgi:hypothetical protein
MKSGHDAGCRLRWYGKSGEKRKNPLLGVVCLLTRGVLIRVGWHQNSMIPTRDCGVYGAPPG